MGGRDGEGEGFMTVVIPTVDAISGNKLYNRIFVRFHSQQNRIAHVPANK